MQLYKGIVIGEKLILGGDLNGHIGRNNNNYERGHGGLRYGLRNEGRRRF